MCLYRAPEPVGIMEGIDIEHDLGESSYDLRSIERQTFGQMYSRLLELRMLVLHGSNGSLNDERRYESAYRSLATTMAQHLKHYMTDEEDVELAQRTENWAPDTDAVNSMPCDQIQDNIESLRHTAGLKLPQDSNPDPESVGAAQL